MEFKNKIFVIGLMLIFLLSVSFVSAAQDNGAMADDADEVLTSIDDEIQEESIINDEILTESINDEILNSEDEKDTLSSELGSYDELQYEIDNTADGGTFYLNHNHTYASGDEHPHISITKTITIDGGGHYCISGNKEKGIFRFDDADDEDDITLTLQNLILKDARSDNGAVIHTKKDVDINIINCTFIGNEAIEDGGAIYFDSDGTLDIKGSTFENCLVKLTDGGYTKHNGGAINTHDGTLIIDNCIFRNNTAGFGYGGAIYLQGECSGIRNSVFDNNLANSRFGGAVYVETDNSNGLIIDNCSFTNNTSKSADRKQGSGGAVYYDGSGLLRITNSNFTKNEVLGSATWNKDEREASRAFYMSKGGAVSSLHRIEIGNCTFIKNHAVDKGGAVFTEEEITWLGPCTFISNTVGHTNSHLSNKGGAICAAKFTNDVNGSVFIDNHAWYGGAIYIHDKNEITFESCVFRNNSVWNNDGKAACGGAVYIDSASSKIHLINNIIVNNHATDDRGFYNCGVYGTIEHNWFGTNSPNFDDAYLLEWHRIGSNDKRSDSNYLQLRFVSDTELVYESDATLTAYFVDCKGNNFTGKLTGLDVIFYSDVEADEFSPILIGDNSATVVVSANGAPVHVISAKADYQTLSFTLNQKGNFTWLWEQISAADGVYELTRDLTYSNNVDKFDQGIDIGKEIRINGNGHTIDAGKCARIFKILSSNVIIDNITFVNGMEIRDGGGAIFIDGAENVSILNSVFKNNYAQNYGGAIFAQNANNITIKNSNFTDNFESESGGGAILLSRSNNSLIENCVFSNNKACQGGALDLRSDNITINGCEFTNNSAWDRTFGGGAINSFGENLSISNSLFLDNKAEAYSLDYEIQGNTLILTFEGMENYMNAIRSDYEIIFSNVSYWNGEVVTGDNPRYSSNESGINITVEVFNKDGNMVKKVNLQSDANGQAKFDFSTMQGGNYTFRAYHAEDSYYGEIDTEGEFNISRYFVDPSSVNITTENKKEFLHDRIIIEFSVDNRTDVNIVITNQNASEVFYDYMTENNRFEMSLPVSDEYYNITVYNVGSDTVAPSKDSILFKVVKENSNIQIESLPSPIEYGTSASIRFAGDNDCHEYNVTIYDENNETVFSDLVWVANTYGSMEIPILNVGEYSITVTNLGNDNKKENSASGKFNVSKGVNNFAVIVNDGVYGEKIRVTVNADIDGEYIVSINSTNITVLVENGTGSNFIELPAGDYEANVTFKSENTNNNAVNDTFTVRKAQSNVLIIDMPENITYGIDNVIYLNDDFPANYNVLIFDEGLNIAYNATIASTNFTIPNNLTVGTYNLTVINLGNDNVEGFNTSSIFSITKVNNVLVYAEDSDFGRELFIAIEADVDGFYTVDINGTNITIEVIDGFGFLEDELIWPAGEYYANASFDNPNYDNVIENATFKINMAESNIHIESMGNVSYGDEIVLDFYDDYADVFEIIITDQDGNIELNITTDAFSLVLSDFDAGNYTALVVNPGFESVIGSNDTINFTISKAKDYLFDVNVIGSTMTIDLPEAATGNVSLKIGNKTFSQEIKDGKVVFDLGELALDDYVAEISYPGDKNYEASALNKTVSVEKLSIIASNAKYGWAKTINYQIKVQDNKGNPESNVPITFKINGKTYNAKTNAKGIATVSLNLNVGTYAITISSPHAASVSKNIAVVKRLIQNKNINMYYFDGTVFKVRAIGNNGNPAGAGQVVVFKLNKKTYKVKTDKNGYAKLKVPKTVKVGKYTITATYMGQTVKNTIKVKQNLKLKKVKVKKSAKKLVLKATLKNGKKAVKGKKLTFRFKGKKYTAKTNKKGIAKVVIKKKVLKKLKKGKKLTYKVTYLKNTVKRTVKIKR